MVYIICILPYEYYMVMMYILWLYIYGYLNLFLFGVAGCIRSLALGSDALILPLVRILYIPLRFGLGCGYGWRL
jgi:hypothetical protein